MRMLIKKIANMVPRFSTALDYGKFSLTGGAPRRFDNHPDVALLDEIERTGFIIIPGYWTRAEAEQGMAEIERIFAEHPDHVRRFSDVRIFGAEELSGLIDRFYGDPWLQGVSDAYSGQRTVNAFTMANKVQPGPASKGSGEGWHKDSSFRQFKAFLYLNDVGIDQGPLELIAGSHRLGAYLRGMKAAGLRFRHLRISDTQIEDIVKYSGDRRVPMVADAGTLILADTACIHRGRPPVEGVRYALTNYYVQPSQLSYRDVDEYRPVNPQKLLRLGGVLLE